MPRSESSLVNQRAPAPMVEKNLAEFEREMGGRQAIVELLAHVPRDEEVDYIWALLADPAAEGRSLARVCMDGNVKPGTLLSLVRSGELSKAQGRSLRRIARLLPDVAEDVMKRALPRKVKCGDCLGAGLVESEGKKVPCLRCDGSGRMDKEPSPERQKMALEIGGLIKKGPVVQIQQNQFQANINGSLKDFQTHSDKILYRVEEPAVDAEVTEE